MTGDRPDFTISHLPAMRRLVADAGWLGRRTHAFHLLLEFDITVPRRRLREQESRTGRRHSLTAFLISCLARAVASERSVQAQRSWGRRLVVFHDVDVLTFREIDVEGRSFPLPHVLRRADDRSVADIERELRVIGDDPRRAEGWRTLRWFPRLPWPIRRLIYALIGLSPRLKKRHCGTVVLTAIGMFWRGGGWVVGSGFTHPLGVLVGGIAERTALLEGRPERREYLSLTLAVDHDLVDGGPAGRFAERLRTLVESGDGLAEA